MKQRKVLTIDDDEDVNNLISVILRKNDYDVRTCQDINEYFSQVIEYQPNLCLVDLNLGDYEGFGFGIIETMRKKIGHEMIIVVMSRRSKPHDINKALECGANDYIQKPIDENILISKLNVFLDKNNDDINFPDRPIPAGDQDATFEIPMNITSINEKSIFLYSRSYIAKGSLISLHNSFFKGFKFGVQSVTLNRELGGYIIEIHVDKEEHTELLPEIRKMMLQCPPVDED